jgi:hypothetical protein
MQTLRIMKQVLAVSLFCFAFFLLPTGCGFFGKSKKGSSQAETTSQATPKPNPLNSPALAHLKNLFERPMDSSSPEVKLMLRQNIFAFSLEKSVTTPLEKGRCLFGITGMEAKIFQEKMAPLGEAWVLSPQGPIAASQSNSYAAQECRCVWDQMKIYTKDWGGTFFYDYFPEPGSP